MSKPEYTMSISLNILDHLGVNLYSDIPPVLSEAVANSWDADATEVDIDIDTKVRKIIITDNGHGMTLDDMNNKYLTVGYDRRNDDKERGITRPRRVMGRKGIGKLALFSIADTVEVQSVTGEGENGFVMSAQKIKEQSRKEQNSREEATPYHPDSLPDDKITLGKKGTRITLTKLKTRVTKATANALKKRLARRFSIIGEEHNFTVRIDGNPVDITDRDHFHKLQYLWHHGEGSEKYVEFCKKKPDYVEKREGKAKADEQTSYTVKGWIGTTDLPSDLKDSDENLNKIIIMVRGKLAQEDILEDITEGGVYIKYLIGEIHADFLDLDDLEDIATSSRQEIIKDDPRYIALRSWVNEELKHIKYKWTDLRNEGGVKEATQIPAIKKWLKSLGRDKQEQAKALLGKIGQLTIQKDQRFELYQYTVLAFEKLKYRDSLSALENVSPENIQAFTKAFAELDKIEATLYYDIVQDRLRVIDTLRKHTEDNVREKLMQKLLYDHLWLLDPSWDRASGSAYMEKTVKAEFDTIDAGLDKEERRGRIDIKYKMTSGKHVIIELKRARVVMDTLELIQQVDKYRTALEKLLDKHNKKEPVDIVCIVGTPLKQWTDPRARARLENTLEQQNIRIVSYQELIDNAYQSYQEFLEANEEAGRVYELVKNIELEIQQKDVK